MNTNAKISLPSINRCRDNDLAPLTRRVLDNLTGNAQFPNPSPTPNVVEKALAEYIVALSNAGGFDRKLVSIKNDKRVALRALLLQLVQYVTQISRGDKTLLLSSGFTLTPGRSAPGKLPPKLEVDISLPRQATTQVKRVARARAYIHQYAADPLTDNSVWAGETTHLHQYTFTGLTTATKIWFRVIALTHTGEQLVYEPVARVIQ
jgi:hypothetical protein